MHHWIAGGRRTSLIPEFHLWLIAASIIPITAFGRQIPRYFPVRTTRNDIAARLTSRPNARPSYSAGPCEAASRND